MREIGLDRIELELLAKEITGRGGFFNFKARGFSMYPFIRDGDILTIGPVNTNELKLGDIILYKSFDDRIVLHRFIGRVKIGNDEMLKVRGDALMGKPEYIVASKVIGKAFKQQRDSKVIDLQRGASKFIAHIWLLTYPIGSFCLYFVFATRKILSSIFRFIQSFRLYRKFAKIFIGKKVEYLTIVDDLNFLGNKLKEFYGFTDIDSINNRDLAYEICAYIGEKKIGSVTLLRVTENNLLYPDWWLFGMEVRTLYRGAGIGKNLIQLAISKAYEVGANRLNLLVSEKNRVAENLYKKMGFKKFSIPILDNELGKEVLKGYPRRIIMSRAL